VRTILSYISNSSSFFVVGDWNEEEKRRPLGTQGYSQVVDVLIIDGSRKCTSMNHKQQL